jgi:hypothetical protein
VGAAVSQAVLAAFDVLGGESRPRGVATLLWRRGLAALASGLLAHAATGGRMLPSLGAGLAALLLVRALL